jgi:hypothetical protein
MTTFDAGGTSVNATDVRLRSHGLRIQNVEHRLAQVTRESVIPGPPGPQGPQGDVGPMPLHQWRGSELRFQLSPEQWGAWVDLQGPPGKDGERVVGGGYAPSSVGLFTLNSAGIVPGPTSGDVTKFLRGDATWQTPSSYMPGGW